MQKITSTSNEKIKFLKTLKTKKGREQSGTYLIEGSRAVLDALDHGVHFKTVLVQEDAQFNVPDAENVYAVSRHIIEALSDTQSPEGIIAEAYIPDLHFDLSRLNGLTVFLDRLQDAGNLGTIIRTCDAAGASAVVLSPDCVEVFNPKTVRSTMGSVFNIPVMVAENSVAALNAIKEAGYTVFAADLHGEDFYSLNNINSTKSCIIIGNEGNGISDAVRACADRVLTLPMRGGAESLNAAVAAGILIYGFMFH